MKTALPVYKISIISNDQTIIEFRLPQSLLATIERVETPFVYKAPGGFLIEVGLSKRGRPKGAKNKKPGKKVNLPTRRRSSK